MPKVASYIARRSNPIDSLAYWGFLISKKRKKAEPSPSDIQYINKT
jgi:hypothetical protein